MCSNGDAVPVAHQVVDQALGPLGRRRRRRRGTAPPWSTPGRRTARRRPGRPCRTSSTVTSLRNSISGIAGVSGVSVTGHLSSRTAVANLVAAPRPLGRRRRCREITHAPQWPDGRCLRATCDPSRRRGAGRRPAGLMACRRRAARGDGAARGRGGRGLGAGHPPRPEPTASSARGVRRRPRSSASPPSAPARTSRTAELLELHVRPDRRREGHGSRLLAASVDQVRAQGAQTATAWVGATDDAARAFLSEAGLGARRLPPHPGPARRRRGRGPPGPPAHGCEGRVIEGIPAEAFDFYDALRADNSKAFWAGAQGRLRHVRPGPATAAGGRARRRVRPGAPVPALPRRAVQQGQGAVQGPPGRLRRGRRRGRLLRAGQLGRPDGRWRVVLAPGPAARALPRGGGRPGRARSWSGSWLRSHARGSRSAAT